jgi:hypothetical protein
VRKLEHRSQEWCQAAPWPADGHTEEAQPIEAELKRVFRGQANGRSAAGAGAGAALSAPNSQATCKTVDPAGEIKDQPRRDRRHHPVRNTYVRYRREKRTGP